LVGGDGGVFALGGVPFAGSISEGAGPGGAVVGIVVTPVGYRLVEAQGAQTIFRTGLPPVAGPRM
jgi:hypothetical protein